MQAIKQDLPAATPDQWINVNQVGELLNLKKTAIYALAGTQGFPEAIRLSHRCVRWSRRAVTAWMEARAAGRSLGTVTATSSAANDPSPQSGTTR